MNAQNLAATKKSVMAGELVLILAEDLKALISRCDRDYIVTVLAARLERESRAAWAEYREQQNKLTKGEVK